MTSPATLYSVAGDQLVRRGRSGATIPPPPPPPLTGSLGLIGDSLTYQGGSTAARDALIAAGWPSGSLRVDGVTGRGMAVTGAVHPDVGEVVASWRGEGFDPDTWVIALGSNNLGSSDATWLSAAKAVLDLIAAGPKPSYRVYWVMLVLRRSPAPTDASSTQAVVDRFQAVIESLVGYNSKINLVPLDIESHIYNGRDQSGLWLTTDTSGRHMTTAGYTIRNQFIASQVPATTVPPVTGSARFPGDPGPGSGKLIRGIDEFDKDPKTKLPAEDAAPEAISGVPAGGMREYFSTMSAISSAGGAGIAAINRQHAQGRIPWLSIALGNWAAQAGSTHNAAYDFFIDWVETSAKGPVWFSLLHEPENQTVSKGGNAGTEAQWLAVQKAFRARMDAYEASHGGLGSYKWKNLAFANCMTAYCYFEAGKAGGIDRYIPTAADADVFDFCGVDYYAWTVGAPMWGANIRATVAWTKRYKKTLAIAEWGVHHENPDAAGMMQEFDDRCLDPANDIIAHFYYNSAVSATSRALLAQRWMLNNGGTFSYDGGPRTYSNGGLLNKFVSLQVASSSVHFWDLKRPDGVSYKRPAGV